MAANGTFRNYTDKKFNAEHTRLIACANAIISEYEPRGLKLTLRQLYYQYVARDIFANEERNYQLLKRVTSEARMAGKISWTAIEDRGRNLMGHRTHKSPKEALKALREDYRRDLWDNQPCRPEVWVEKQALEGVVGSICDGLRVDYFATKGYNSQSEQWSAGQRFAGYYQRGQRPIVLHLGDHDPSGLDMTRDNEERLSLFVGTPVPVVRIALNMDQIEELRPPPNPAKQTDGRFAEYADKYFPGVPYGEVSSWELDALDPAYIRRLIETHVARFRDPRAWEAAVAQEAEDLNDIDVMIEEAR